MKLRIVRIARHRFAQRTFGCTGARMLCDASVLLGLVTQRRGSFYQRFGGPKHGIRSVSSGIRGLRHACNRKLWFVEKCGSRSVRRFSRRFNKRLNKHEREINRPHLFPRQDHTTDDGRVISAHFRAQGVGTCWNRRKAVPSGGIGARNGGWYRRRPRFGRKL